MWTIIFFILTFIVNYLVIFYSHYLLVAPLLQFGLSTHRETLLGFLLALEDQEPPGLQGWGCSPRQQFLWRWAEIPNGARLLRVVYL